MRGILLGSICLMLGNLQAAELHVRAGEVHSLEQPVLHLERLVLEDGATLQLAPALSSLELSAEQAWIGRDVRILARGRNGLPGQPAANAPAAADCQPGAAGAEGGVGERGGDGASLQLRLGLQAFGSLLVDTRGGAGGGGGRGGAGGAGGDSATCIGAAGGRGGRGGDGGAGGKGGDVTLHYWSLGRSGHIPLSNYGPGLWLETAGGAGAEAGEPGAGGRGGAGKAFKRSSGTKVYRDSGVDGSVGESGGLGPDGAAGRFLLQPQADPQR